MMQLATACLLGGEHAVSDHAVFELVAKSRCSAYDCEYVALAEALGTILVTEDQKLLRAFPKRCRSIVQVI
jgi:predicted nucleic acid-binding protein